MDVQEKMRKEISLITESEKELNVKIHFKNTCENFATAIPPEGETIRYIQTFQMFLGKNRKLIIRKEKKNKNKSVQKVIPTVVFPLSYYKLVLNNYLLYTIHTRNYTRKQLRTVGGARGMQF